MTSPIRNKQVSEEPSMGTPNPSERVLRQRLGSERNDEAPSPSTPLHTLRPRRISSFQSEKSSHPQTPTEEYATKAFITPLTGIPSSSEELSELRLGRRKRKYEALTPSTSQRTQRQRLTSSPQPALPAFPNIPTASSSTESLISPTAPLRKATFLPSRPKKSKSSVPQNRPLEVARQFGHPFPLATDSITHKDQLLQQITGQVFKNTLQQLPSGQSIITSQQPLTGNGTCGAGCVLTIALNFFEKMERFSENTEFWAWYTICHNAEAEKLVENLALLNIPAKIYSLTNDASNMQASTRSSAYEYRYLKSEEAISFIKEVIQATGKPVILAITHPNLDGHWIVVHGFGNEEAWVSDPYTGKAYAVSETVLSSWLLEADPVQDMVYFP